MWRQSYRERKYRSVATELSGENIHYSVVQEIRIARVVATGGQRFITADDM